jgi:hypothetical protein
MPKVGENVRHLVDTVFLPRQRRCAGARRPPTRPTPERASPRPALRHADASDTARRGSEAPHASPQTPRASVQTAKSQVGAVY